MQMAGQQEIHPARRKGLDGEARPPYDSLVLGASRHIKGMMRDNDLHDVRGSSAQPLADPRHLLVVEAPAFEDPRAGRIQADDGDLLVSVERLKIGRDIALVFVEPPHEACHGIVERHIVIPRDHDLWPRQRLQESASRQKFPRAGALGQVARHHHHIRLIVGDGGEQGWDKRRITAPKMEI
jgi:hypothetical protein